MTSDKKTVSLLADLFVKKGLSDIIISPGSRNAPIILTFANHQKINALSVVDERSAAFFALGIAQQTRRTVAIACTSGSAVLNYAPAIAEAYYQKIPLLILTADRPPHMIDIGDGQTIRQNNIFAPFIKKSYFLPLDISNEKEFEKVNRIINEAIDQTYSPEPGPVHINIPFDEPLYETVEKGVKGIALDTSFPLPPVSKFLSTAFIEIWNSSRKIIVLAGQSSRVEPLQEALSFLAGFHQVIILTETTSNLSHPDFIDCIDNVLTAIDKDEAHRFQPDLLITFGGAVVSKKIKKFLRENKPRQHWRFSASGEKMDTFFALTRMVTIEPVNFLKKVLPELQNLESLFREGWLQKKSQVDLKRKKFLALLPYSDLKVFKILFNNIPDNSVLHLGNSTPVRYSQLFGSTKQFQCFSNRGVSGIDGQLSTASGFAFADNVINTMISGDLGFFYDSNALMNQNLTPNLKIIVINNGGGGIFRFIPGPDTSSLLEHFFVAKHHWKAEKLAAAFDIPYFTAGNEQELIEILPVFYSNLSRPALLEIFTPSEENALVLQNYFSFLKSSSH